MASSSLGYPFSHRGKGFISSLISSVTQLIVLPWHIFLSWISWLAAFAITTLTRLGVPPQGFIPAHKLRELHSIVDHMHIREDLYRKAIRELQDEIDAKEGDRKKALRKLKATKDEISQLSVQLTELQHTYQNAAAESTPVPHSQHHPTTKLDTSTRLVIHATCILMAFHVWWFCQVDHGALQWKIVFSMFFPLVWMYMSWISSSKIAHIPLLLICSSWFLIGYILSQTIHGEYLVDTLQS